MPPIALPSDPESSSKFKNEDEHLYEKKNKPYETRLGDPVYQGHSQGCPYLPVKRLNDISNEDQASTEETPLPALKTESGNQEENHLR